MGSEMCIRDSLSTRVQARSAHESEPQRKFSARECGAMKVAVIYPHDSPNRSKCTAFAEAIGTDGHKGGGQRTSVRREVSMPGSIRQRCIAQRREMGLARSARKRHPLERCHFDAIIAAPRDPGCVLDTRCIWVEPKSRPVHMSEIVRANAALREAGLKDIQMLCEDPGSRTPSSAFHVSPIPAQYGVLRPTSAAVWRRSSQTCKVLREGGNELEKLAAFL